METKWLRHALFAGQTADAFKLGTALSLGWFWMRTSGCRILYRGPSMTQVDFDDLLAVVNVNAESVSPSDYLAHASDTTYFYVVRGVNSCGQEENTLGAAAKVAINADGDLVDPKPNGVFALAAEQVESDKIQLLWYYCGLDQEVGPNSFKVYYDNGTGQIDFQNALAEITYVGRRFYTYRSGSLADGRYLFAVRTEDSNGQACSCPVYSKVQFESAAGDPITILSVQTI